MLGNTYSAQAASCSKALAGPSVSHAEEEKPCNGLMGPVLPPGSLCAWGSGSGPSPHLTLWFANS